MSRMAQPEEFWDKVSERYAARPIADQDTYAHTMARTKAVLTPGDKVLEIGCGTGGTARLLAPDVAQITGTDVSAGMIAIAERKLAESALPNVAFRQSPAVDAIFEPAQFDAVLAFNLLHLLDDPAHAIARAHVLLKPGGVLISKTPCLGEMGIIPRLLIPAMRAVGKAPFVGFPTAEELEGAMQRAGFTIEVAEYHPATKKNRFIVARKAR